MKISRLATISLLLFATGAGADDPIDSSDAAFLVSQTGKAMEWLPADPGQSYELRIQAPDGTVTSQVFLPGEVPTWALQTGAKGAMNGLYAFELRAVSMEDRNRAEHRELKAAGGGPAVHASGYFSVAAGTVVSDQRRETASKDIVHADDVIINGSSLCVGFDCVNNENFGFDTVRLKENNLRLHFDDTSNSGSFPRNDWRLVANDSGNGGASYLAIEDATSGRRVFAVEAGAPNSALYMDSGGDLGVGTATPVVDVHAVDGNTPTLRLDQDGSGGWGVQVWDVAANEANFFVRDVTGGSQLPFRIIPGADTNSLYVASDNSVGMGTASPAAPLHVSRSGGTPAEIRAQTTGGVETPRRMLFLTNNGDPLFRLENTASGTQWDFRSTSNGFAITRVGSGQLEAEVRNNGDLAIAGTLSEGSSRSIKDDIVTIDHATVLAKLERLPLSEWNYTGDPADRHLGPMAEDFHAAFGLGPDNKHIAPKDLAGVALAAAKALKAENQVKIRRISELERENQELERRLELVERKLGIR